MDMYQDTALSPNFQNFRSRNPRTEDLERPKAPKIKGIPQDFVIRFAAQPFLQKLGNLTAIFTANIQHDAIALNGFSENNTF